MTLEERGKAIDDAIAWLSARGIPTTQVARVMLLPAAPGKWKIEVTTKDGVTHQAGASND